ncbi:endonuclease SmrB [Pseudoalteromonas denitrificans]|nr:endonuclease SmrB [Pseudoalteromonas denitrificans]
MQSNDNTLTPDDSDLFRDMFSGTNKLQQDKVVFKRNALQKKHKLEEEEKKKRLAEFYFSDEYVPNLENNGTISYVQEGQDSYLAKQLRRGDFYPELVLDLHGLNKEQAKKELIALISECKRQHYRCACIVHGIGEFVLKQKIPHYLVQHPDILAMHQAPLEFGGKGALLVVINQPANPKF